MPPPRQASDGILTCGWAECALWVSPGGRVTSHAPAWGKGPHTACPSDFRLLLLHLLVGWVAGLRAHLYQFKNRFPCCLDVLQ